MPARIIDRDDGPTPLSKAVGIGARSLDILDASLVTPRLLEDGIRVVSMVAHTNGQRLGTVDLTRVSHRYNFLLALPQAETEAVMADTLCEFGGKVEWGTRLEGLREDTGSVMTRLATGNGIEEAAFDCVFGADGVHSTTREAVKIGFDGFAHERRWSIADVELDAWPYPRDAAHLFFHDNGDVGFIVPIAPGRYRAVSNTEDAMARIPGSFRVREVLRTAVFEIHIRQAPTYQTARVFLGGDAAHVHSPVGARGMNLGIEDAASFARRLAEGTLDGYTAERRPAGRRWIALSERILRAAEATGWPQQALRNLAVRVVGHVPLLQRPLVARVSGLKE